MVKAGTFLPSSFLVFPMQISIGNQKFTFTLYYFSEIFFLRLPSNLSTIDTNPFFICEFCKSFFFYKLILLKSFTCLVVYQRATKKIVFKSNFVFNIIDHSDNKDKCSDIFMKRMQVFELLERFRLHFTVFSIQEQFTVLHRGSRTN